MIIIATILAWIGFGLGLLGMVMLLVCDAPAGHEDRDGFHLDEPDSDSQL